MIRKNIGLLIAGSVMTMGMSVQAAEQVNGALPSESGPVTEVAQVKDRMAVVPKPMPLVAPQVTQDQMRELAVRERVFQRLPDMPLSQVKKLDDSGLFLLRSADGVVLYVNESVTHVIAGTPDGKAVVVRIEEDQNVNVTEEASRPYNQALLARLSDFVSEHKAKGVEQEVMTVFVDPACPYCHKVKSEVEKYQNAGITVRFAAMPVLSEASTEGVIRVMSVSEDKRNEAMARLETFFSDPHSKLTPEWDKLDLMAREKHAEKAVGLSKTVGQMMGFNGTPGIVMGDGTTFNGYVPAEVIIQKVMAREGELRTQVEVE